MHVSIEKIREVDTLICNILYKMSIVFAPSPTPTSIYTKISDSVARFIYFILEKVYFTPHHYGGGLLNPLNYETVYSTS
jgi:hypothetical protein